jgi:hypothetical protein
LEHRDVGMSLAVVVGRFLDRRRRLLGFNVTVWINHLAWLSDL